MINSKTMKKHLMLCLAAAGIAALVLSGCKDSAGGGGNTRPLTSIDITPDMMSLVVGKTFTPPIIKIPGNATDTIEWSSDDPAKVSVNKSTGEITAVDVTDNPVQVFVRSKQNSSKNDYIYITVLDEEKHLDDLGFVPETQSLVVDEKFTPMLVKSPSDSTDKVEWSSADTNIVTVNEDTGEITAVTVGGPVTVTARSKEEPEVYAECSITVVSGRKPLISLDFESESIFLDIYEIFTPEVSRSPNDTTDTLEWTSSDPNKVSVNKDTGEVTAKAATDSPVRITVKSKQTEGVSAFFDVTVLPPADVPITSVTISGGGDFSKIGSNFSPPARSLTANVSPPNATEQAVQWTSSNTDAAIVSFNGVVTPKGIGSTTITVTTNDPLVTASVTITISAVELGELGAVTIIESEGWLETLYVTWEKLSAAERYKVEYKGTGVPNWIEIDDPLIREYGGCFRADIPGLAEGGYTVRVTPVNSEGEGASVETSAITVEKHDRSGFAFTNGRVPGAYKADGTLKDGAQVIYVTRETAKTVTLAVKESATKTTTGVGIGGILAVRKKGYDKTPLAIRFIGMVKKADIDQLGSNSLLEVKGNNNYTEANITVEGIGDDAMISGWGILVRQTENVEVRNLGFMLFPEDGVSLDTANRYTWVHNCDFFYGENRGGDKKKGDGSLDSKKSGFVTVSYNHYWDAGKVNLLGNGTEPEEQLTLHHNWYDHSDSRHPRVRCHTVHVYNNFYNGIGKYGIGSTIGASIFAEANYFQNSKKPMLISKQGTDIASDSKGTFSGEDGGIIKAYNNYIDEYSRLSYRAYSAANTVEFDAYEVTNRNDIVPDTVKAKQGGRIYNNFDTAPSMYEYDVDSPEDAKTNVMKYAGRYWGGDFSYTFENEDNLLADDPMPAMTAALNAYTSGLVSVQGGGADGGDGGDGGGTEPPPVIDGSVSCSFGMSGSSGSSVFVNNSAFTIVTGNGTKSDKTINGVTYNIALKLESSTTLTFATSAPMTLTAYTDSAGINLDGTNKPAAAGVVTADIAAGAHTIKRHSGSGNLWLIVLSP